MAATITRPAAVWAGRFTVMLFLELDEPFDAEPTAPSAARAGATAPVNAAIRTAARMPARRGDPEARG